jgi:hypothetical protein
VKEEAKKYLFAQFGCVGDGGLSFLYGKNTIHIFHVCGCVVWCPGWEGRDVIIFCLIFLWLVVTLYCVMWCPGWGRSECYKFLSKFFLWLVVTLYSHIIACTQILEMKCSNQPKMTRCHRYSLVSTM